MPNRSFGADCLRQLLNTNVKTVEDLELRLARMSSFGFLPLGRSQPLADVGLRLFKQSNPADFLA